MTEMSDLVAEMRALGVVRYRGSDGVEVDLGPAPSPAPANDPGERETDAQRQDRETKDRYRNLLRSTSTRPRF